MDSANDDMGTIEDTIDFSLAVANSSTEHCENVNDAPDEADGNGPTVKHNGTGKNVSQERAEVLGGALPGSKGSKASEMDPRKVDDSSTASTAADPVSDVAGGDTAAEIMMGDGAMFHSAIESVEGTLRMGVEGDGIVAEGIAGKPPLANAATTPSLKDGVVNRRRKRLDEKTEGNSSDDEGSNARGKKGIGSAGAFESYVRNSLGQDYRKGASFFDEPVDGKKAADVTDTKNYTYGNISNNFENDIGNKTDPNVLKKRATSNPSISATSRKRRLPPTKNQLMPSNKSNVSNKFSHETKLKGKRSRKKGSVSKTAKKTVEKKSSKDAEDGSPFRYYAVRVGYTTAKRNATPPSSTATTSTEDLTGNATTAIAGGVSDLGSNKPDTDPLLHGTSAYYAGSTANVECCPLCHSKLLPQTTPLVNESAKTVPSAKETESQFQNPSIARKAPDSQTRECSNEQSNASTTPDEPSPYEPDEHFMPVRSAIFLRREDAIQYVDFQHYQEEKQRSQYSHKLGSKCVPSEVDDIWKHLKVEYKMFNSIEEAEKYLRKDMKTPEPLPKGSNDCIPPSNSNSNKRSTCSPAAQSPRLSYAPTKKWLEMFRRLEEYKESNGGSLERLIFSDADTAQTMDDDFFKLKRWVKYQRRHYELFLQDPANGNHSMTKEKVRKLKRIGFDFRIRKRGLGERKAGRSEEKDNQGIKSPRKGSLSSAEKVTIVTADIKESFEEPNHNPRQKWLDMLQKLKEYKEKHGTIEIANEDCDELNDAREYLYKLQKWCKNQKVLYRRWKLGYGVGMTQEKVNMLQELGMKFPPSWEEMYLKLKEHVEACGNCEVTAEMNQHLSSWVQRQKVILGRYQSGEPCRMNDEWAKRLLDLGLVGDTPQPTRKSLEADAKWNTMLDALKEFKEKNGHCDYPTNNRTDLGKWISTQRRHYNNISRGKTPVLDARRMQRLSELGFQFRPRGGYVSWEDRMKELKNFVDENGHCKIPVNHRSLGAFVMLMRRDYKFWTQGKKSGMTEERLKDLESVGFVFEVGKTPQRREAVNRTWEDRFQELLNFKEQNGHTIVPQKSGSLGTWVHQQRVHYKNYKEGRSSSMTAEKALKLLEIGFCFDAAERFRGNKQPRLLNPRQKEILLLQHKVQESFQKQSLQQPVHQGMELQRNSCRLT